ncbi:hypothetical protein [Methylobacterium sp. JK268]
MARFSTLAADVPHLDSQVALYHPQARDPFGPDGEPVRLGRALLAPIGAPAGLQVSRIPGGDVALHVHAGPYAQLSATHLGLRRAIAERGRALVGPNWERSLGAGDDPSALRTEVCYLLHDIA